MVSSLLAAVCLSGAVTSTEVEFQGAGIKLAGVVSIPAGEGDKPAVLLLPGSGPSDRDGSQPGVKIDLLKDLAESLNKEGFATMRFDKRPVARYQSVWPKNMEEISRFFSWPNHVADVEAAFRFLASQKGIDGKRIAIVGHSEGAWLAMEAGANVEAKALVTLGGVGRTMGDVLKEQIGRNLANPQVPESLRKSLTEDLDRILTAQKAEAKLPANIPPAYATLFNASTVDIIHGYLNFDSAGTAKKFKGPVLVANGEMDVQVSATRDAQPLFQAFSSRVGGVQKLLIIPKASHNFKQVSSEKEPGFVGPVVGELTAGLVQFLKESL